MLARATLSARVPKTMNQFVDQTTKPTVTNARLTVRKLQFVTEFYFCSFLFIRNLQTQKVSKICTWSVEKKNQKSLKSC